MPSLPPLSNLERQEDILQFIENSRRISIADITQRFNISEATARRDLEFLATQEKIRRVHGGAIALHPTQSELSIYQRMSDQAANKQKIGMAAAELVQDNETVFLGSGTTVLEVARTLVKHRNLAIITNSLLVVNALAEQSTMTIISLGGILRQSEQSMIGHITEDALSELRADKVIMGIHGIDLENGLTNHYLPETMTDRKILQLSKKVIIVADHTKCERTSVSRVAPLSVISTLVTDFDVSPEFVTALTGQGIEVIQA